MTGRPSPATVACAVDTRVLAMVADAGHDDLLAALAPGSLFVAPSIVDRDESPPFSRQPMAAFARGASDLQRRQRSPVEFASHGLRLATGTTARRPPRHRSRCSRPADPSPRRCVGVA